MCAHPVTVTGRVVSFCQYLCESVRVCTQIQVGWFHSVHVCVCVCAQTQLQVGWFHSMCVVCAP